MSKNSPKKQNQNKIKYSWGQWCFVSAIIAIIAVIFLLAGLSIKALVQDIQLIFYENKVLGTVTIAEFKGARYARKNSLQFDEVHYIIAFDEETSGYNQYEYHGKDIIITKVNVGDRYIVLFNNIENPILIQKEDIVPDNIILFLFFALVIIVIILRKKIYMWLTKICEKFEILIWY